MKKVKLLWIPALTAAVMFFGGCTRQKVLVDHDYRFSSGFEDYASYAFLDCENDSNYLCSDVQEAIKTQMKARGYAYQPQKANLLVNFTIYYDPLAYKGYNQPGMMLWLSKKDDKDSKYAPINYFLNKGTLMISLIEAETSELVWRGYATGIFNENSSKKNYFRNIVSSIFNEYPLMAGSSAKAHHDRRQNSNH